MQVIKSIVIFIKPETKWSNREQVEVIVKNNEGLNS